VRCHAEHQLRHSRRSLGPFGYRLQVTQRPTACSRSLPQPPYLSRQLFYEDSPWRRWSYARLPEATREHCEATWLERQGCLYKNVLLYQWAVEQVAIEYQLEGSKPFWSSKMFLKQVVIILQEKLGPDAIEAHDDSIEGRAGGLLRQVYDNVQDCKLGCAPLFAPIPLEILGIAWDNMEDTAVIQSVLCNE
jgi:hypothetical protein